MMQQPRTVIIGFGNPIRADDAVGIEVVRRVRETAGPGIRTREVSADAIQLLFSWEDAELAIVIDAMSTGLAPGSIRRFSAEELIAADADPFPCPHGIGLVEAMRLAAALGRLPKRLVVIGIEGKDFRMSEGMSPEIEAAVVPAIENIRDELNAAGAQETSLPGGIRTDSGKARRDA